MEPAARVASVAADTYMYADTCADTPILRPRTFIRSFALPTCKTQPQIGSAVSFTFTLARARVSQASHLPLLKLIMVAGNHHRAFLYWYHAKARWLLTVIVTILFPCFVLRLWGLYHPIVLVLFGLCTIWTMSAVYRSSYPAPESGAFSALTDASALVPLRAWLHSPLVGCDLCIVYMSCLCTVSLGEQIVFGWAHTGTISRERMERTPLECVAQYFILGVFLATQLPKLPSELPTWRWRRRTMQALLLFRTCQVCIPVEAPWEVFTKWCQVVLIPIAAGYCLTQATASVVGEMWEENSRLRQEAASAQDRALLLENVRREALLLRRARVKGHCKMPRRAKQPAALRVPQLSDTPIPEHEECEGLVSAAPRSSPPRE